MTDYLENSTPMNVIPNYVESFAEASMYVMESVDNDFFAVIESMGLVNDGAIDESAEVVTEGVKDLADKFIGALKSLWEKIQGWFAQVKEWFDRQAANAKEHFDKIIKKASDATIGKIDASMLEGVKADKKVGSYTVYNIDVAQISTAYKAVANAVSVIKLSADSGDNAIMDIPAAMEELDKIGGKNAKEIAAFVKKNMVGSTKKDATIGDIKGDFNEIKAVVFGNDKKVLSAAYTTQKKAIDEAIKKINSLKSHKVFKSAEQKSGNKDLAKAAVFCKNANQALHAYHSAVVGLMRARFVQYAHIISVCVSAALVAKAKAKVGKKAEEKKATNESVTLESLFEW